MKLTNVGLISNQSEVISLSLDPTEADSPYLVRTMIGLDAEEIIPKFYGFGVNGQRFYDYKLRPRDIVIRVVLNPRFHLDETYSYVRDQLYRMISASRTGQVQLQFFSGGTYVANIYGFITKVEVPYFSKTPELQITIRCNDPLFRSPIQTQRDVDNLPTTNPFVLVDDVSTAPHGFEMEVVVNQTLATFTIQDRATNPEWVFHVVPGSNFLTGDVIHFSSEFTNKYLYMDRGGVITHLMDRIDPTSVWPIMFPMRNEMHFNNVASFDWGFIRYHATYWGI